MCHLGTIQAKMRGNEEILDYLKALPKVHEKRYAIINKCRWWKSETCKSLSETNDSPEYKYIQRMLPINWCGWGKAIWVIFKIKGNMVSRSSNICNYVNDI